jgi:hypothetical protein
MPLTEFGSGTALRLDTVPAANRDVLVRYTAPLGPLTALEDNAQEVTGLEGPAHDIPPLGAAIALAAPRDIRRTDMFAQGDTRRAEEVPAGSPQSAVRALMALRDRRISAELSRLGKYRHVLRRDPPRHLAVGYDRWWS